MSDVNIYVHFMLDCYDSVLHAVAPPLYAFRLCIQRLLAACGFLPFQHTHNSFGEAARVRDHVYGLHAYCCATDCALCYVLLLRSCLCVCMRVDGAVCSIA